MFPWPRWGLGLRAIGDRGQQTLGHEVVPRWDRFGGFRLFVWEALEEQKLQ